MKIMPNIWSASRNKYRALDPADKSIVRSYIYLFIVIIIFMLINEIIKSELFVNSFVKWPAWIRDPVEIFSTSITSLAAILLSIMVAIVFSVLDRLSLLSPLEREMADKVTKLDNNINALNELIDQQNKKVDNIVSDTIKKSLDYDKYAVARGSFGFNSVVGLTIRKSKIDPDVSIEKDNFILKIFRNSPPGGEILYMNSFITDDQQYHEALIIAIKRGTAVRMMLMTPREDSPVAHARWMDCYKHMDEYEEYSDFIAEIKQKFTKFARLSTKMNSSTPLYKPGAFELREYAVSLNHPMVIVREDINSPTIDRAYTGFYMSLDANEMPYIEWRGGDVRILNRFSDMFEQKWMRVEPSMDLIGDIDNK
jgi:hypothetical protein